MLRIKLTGKKWNKNGQIFKGKFKEKKSELEDTVLHLSTSPLKKNTYIQINILNMSTHITPMLTQHLFVQIHTWIVLWELSVNHKSKEASLQTHTSALPHRHTPLSGPCPAYQWGGGQMERKKINSLKPGSHHRDPKRRCEGIEKPQTPFFFSLKWLLNPTLNLPINLPRTTC